MSAISAFWSFASCCFYFAGLIPIHGLAVKNSLVVVEIQVFAAWIPIFVGKNIILFCSSLQPAAMPALACSRCHYVLFSPVFPFRRKTPAASPDPQDAEQSGIGVQLTLRHASTQLKRVITVPVGRRRWFDGDGDAWGRWGMSRIVNVERT